MTGTHSEVLLLAPLCRDTVIVGNTRFSRAGGSGLFAAWALARLGAVVRLHTSLAERDTDLLPALPMDRISLTLHPSRNTTHFEIECDPNDPDQRAIRRLAASDPLDAGRIDPEGCGYILLAPLLASDVDADLISFLSTSGLDVDLGLQGLCRRIGADGILSIAPPDPLPVPALGIIAGDEREIAAIPEEFRRIAGEIVTTLGGRGARITLPGPPQQEIGIPASRVTGSPREAIGLGDTFLAVYGWWRRQGIAPRDAGDRAAWAAARLLEEGLPRSG